MSSKTQISVFNNNKKMCDSIDPQYLKLNEDDVICPICLCILVEPVTMQCKHSTCKKCFLQILQESTLQCPVCRCRIGNFARHSMKSKELVNTRLWNAIKEQFMKKLDLEQSKNSPKVLSSSGTCGLECVAVNTAKPGEILKEFKDQALQLLKLNKAMDPGRLEQEKNDEHLAASLNNNLNSRACITRKASKQKSIIDKNRYKVGTPNDNEALDALKRKGFFTPKNCISSPPDQEESDVSDGNASETEMPTRKSSRQLFKERSCSSAPVKGDRRNTTKGSLNACHSASHRTKNETSSDKRKSSTASQQFPGLRKRPRLAGTSNLSVSCHESSGDELSASQNLLSDSKMTSDRSMNNSTLNKASSSVRKTSITLTTKKTATVSAKNSNQISEGTAGGPNESRTPGGGSSSTTSSPGTSGHGSDVGPLAQPTATSPQDPLSDDVEDILALFQDIPNNEISALIAEQKALETQLRQEAEDAKLARLLQKQLSRIIVDRTKGSGEEYSLRCRRDRSSALTSGVSRRSAQTTCQACTTVRKRQSSSPCY